MPSPNKDTKYLFISLCIHAAVFVLLVAGLDVHAPTPVLTQSFHNDTISAVVLGDIEKSKLLPQPVKQVEKPPVVEKKPPTMAKVRQPKESEAARKDVIALKAIEKKKKLAKQKALEESRLKKRAKAQAKKRLLAKKRAKAKKKQLKIEDEFLADLKKLEKKTLKKKQLAKKRLQNRFKETLKEQAEASMRQQLLDEEIRLQSIKARQARGEVNKYKALILQAISENWIVPRHANRKLYSELMIRLAPDGMVMDVQVTKTSGDRALDSSARAAVLKSSPLPVPKDGSAFEAFRQFVLKVKPENIIPSS